MNRSDKVVAIMCGIVGAVIVTLLTSRGCSPKETFGLSSVDIQTLRKEAEFANNRLRLDQAQERLRSIAQGMDRDKTDSYYRGVVFGLADDIQYVTTSWPPGASNVIPSTGFTNTFKKTVVLEGFSGVIHSTIGIQLDSRITLPFGVTNTWLVMKSGDGISGVGIWAGSLWAPTAVRTIQPK